MSWSFYSRQSWLQSLENIHWLFIQFTDGSSRQRCSIKNICSKKFHKIHIDFPKVAKYVRFSHKIHCFYRTFNFFIVVIFTNPYWITWDLNKFPKLSWVPKLNKLWHDLKWVHSFFLLEQFYKNKSLIFNKKLRTSYEQSEAHIL